MIFDVLCAGHISRIEVEVIFLSHALWLGVIFSFFLRSFPGLPAAVAPLIHLGNPHVWLTIAVWISAWHLPRLSCKLICAGIMAFGIVRNLVGYQKYVFNVAEPHEPTSTNSA